MTNEQKTTIEPPRAAGSTLSRYVSFVMLVVTILVCGFFFYNVIKGFLLPLFLAALLAVIFRPFHQYVRDKCTSRPALAAAISTSAIMLIVLVPLAGLLALGLYEGNQVIRDRRQYLMKANEIRSSLGLQKPFAVPLDTIETELRKLDVAIADGSDTQAIAEMQEKSAELIRAELQTITRIGRDAVKDMWSDMAKTPVGEWFRRYENRLKAAQQAAPPADSDSEDSAAVSPARAAEIQEELLEGTEINAAEAEYAIALNALLEEITATDLGPLGPPFTEVDRTPEKRALAYLVRQSIQRPKGGFLPLLDAFDQSILAWETTIAQPTRMTLRQSLTDTQVEYNALRTGLFGGPIWNWALELLNPSSQRINEWLSWAVAGGATRWLPSITNTATSLILGLMVGLGIMAVSLFYFFMDGPTMINTFMHLSPLDDRHEMELLIEFDKVSRAVVLATLLSAVAQGILGGIGYKLVGLEAVFLLTLLTTVLALVPFVGAAAIWLPCCLYLAFVQASYGRAVILALYGIGIISMADNIIKPWVLQGQSKLHPLLALLSVLGGVQALGPIGILVGPMVVAFLQVLLTILQREITSLDEEMKKSTSRSS